MGDTGEGNGCDGNDGDRDDEEEYEEEEDNSEMSVLPNPCMGVELQLHIPPLPYIPIQTYVCPHLHIHHLSSPPVATLVL